MTRFGYFFAALVLHSCCVPAAEASMVAHSSKTENLEDEVSLVQVKLDMQSLRGQSRTEDQQSAREHYWPQSRGGPGHYSRTPYGLPQEVLKHGNLTDHLAWKWEHPRGTDYIIWGTLLDRDKNIYIIGQEGIYKLSPDGETIWQREDLFMPEMGAISGDDLCVMTMGTAVMTCLDIASGKTLWSRQVGESTGMNGDMVTSNGGVVVAAVGTIDIGWGDVGAPSERVIGVNASTGDELWTYMPDCGLWNIMGLFPDEDTVNFMDSCGGVYRLGLFNGSQLWKRAPDQDAWTDGGATLGPDDSVYTCSDEPGSLSVLSDTNSMEGIKGRVRKFRHSTGEMLWETEMGSPCLNFPAVSADGKMLVLADGANVLLPMMTYETDGMSREAIDKLYNLQQEWLQEKRQAEMWGQNNVNGSIMGFDAQTGKLKWQHKVEPWWGTAFAGDEERAYNHLVNGAQLPHCGPPHWGGPTIDDNGNVYIARSSGTFYVYNPEDDSELQFATNDGHMMSGVAFAPGLMVVPSCSYVYVFRY